MKWVPLVGKAEWAGKHGWADENGEGDGWSWKESRIHSWVPFSSCTSFHAQVGLLGHQRMSLWMWALSTVLVGACRALTPAEGQPPAKQCFVHRLFRVFHTQWSCRSCFKLGLRDYQVLALGLIRTGHVFRFRAGIPFAGVCQCRWLAQGLFCDSSFV